MKLYGEEIKAHATKDSTNRMTAEEYKSSSRKKTRRVE